MRTTDGDDGAGRDDDDDDDASSSASAVALTTAASAEPALAAILPFVSGAARFARNPTTCGAAGGSGGGGCFALALRAVVSDAHDATAALALGRVLLALPGQRWRRQHGGAAAACAQSLGRDRRRAQRAATCA